MSQTEVSSARLTKTGIPVRNLWHMLLYVWDAVHLKSQWKSDVENAPTIDALFASMLANLMHQRLRIGLGRDYLTCAIEIAGIRGRVDFAQSLRRSSFQRGRAFCHFELFGANVKKNQIVRSTLARLVQVGEFSSDALGANKLRSRLRKLIREMESVGFVELNTADIQKEQLKRHDADYRMMLAICSLLARKQMPTEDVGVNFPARLDREAFILFHVFEKFIAKFYAHHLKDWNVWPQKKFLWPAEEAIEYLPAMYPDLTLQSKASGNLVVIDTKFTPKSLVTGQWGKQVFNRDHLFQLYAYLRSQEFRSEHHQTSTGVLLYPTVKHALSHASMIQGHSIRWETVDLSKPWEQVEVELLAIPKHATTGLS